MKNKQRRQRRDGESERSAVSDGRTGVTLAASKRCGLSCRWALVLQRSTKKRPVFFFVFLQSPKAIMWQTSRTGSGFPPPASPFRCLAALPTEKPSHLSPPLSLQVQSLHPSHVSPLLFMIFPHFISPNRILHQTRHFFPVSARVSEDLSSSAGVHLSAGGTARIVSHLCRAATSHCARRLSSVPSPW